MGRVLCSARSCRATCVAEQRAVQAFEDELELAGGDLDALSVGGHGERHTVSAAIEALVEDAVAGPVVPEQLHVREPCIVKEEGLSGTRVGAEDIAHEAREAIEGEVKVDGARGGEDLGGQLHEGLSSSMPRGRAWRR